MELSGPAAVGGIALASGSTGVVVAQALPNIGKIEQLGIVGLSVGLALFLLRHAANVWTADRAAAAKDREALMQSQIALAKALEDLRQTTIQSAEEKTALLLEIERLRRVEESHHAWRPSA